MAEPPDWVPEGIEVTMPNAARVYDYVLGGYHNFAADREFVDQALKVWPNAAAVGHAHRAFVRRSVRWLVAEAGIRQFLDIGSGIPTLGNVHEIAQAAAPDAHVIYVDIDPVAVAHSKAILADNPLANALQADLRDVDDILRHRDLTALLDFERPVAVLFNSVLHFVADDGEVLAVLDRLRDAMVRDSYLVITHGTAVAQFTREQSQVTELYRSTNSVPGHLRGPDQLAAMVDGMDVVAPGIVPVTEWHPDPEEKDDLAPPAMLSVVARQP
ncbi:MAG TPA: SAM-dependent methyltransferase [Pseudonocardiaceae bacterium]|nr:SAM-dependent methyltransferase [Pseudonocardiaceae bacterium]